MKILTIAATPFFGDRGCHIRIYNKAKYLQKTGAEVLVCTYHLGEDVREIQIKRISNSDGYQKTTPGFAWGKLWLDLKLLILCSRELKRGEFDIIHAHLFEGLAIARFAKLFAFKKIPIVLDLQGDLEDELHSYNQSQKNTGSFLVWLSKIVFGWADAAVVSSRNALEKINSKYKPKKPVEVVGDGVDEDIFQNPDPKKYFTNREELKMIEEWKGKEKLLIYTGGINDSKGARNLLEEFLAGAKDFEKWKLLMYGKGADREKYQYLAIQTGQEDRVWFAEESGYFALPHYLELADLAIDPKKDSSESSGKLAGYMAAGLPVICFDNEFNRAILGEKGLYLKGWESFSKNLKDLEKRDFSEKMSYNLSHENQNDSHVRESSLTGRGQTQKNRISYDLSQFSEEREVEKLREVFDKITR